MASEWLPEDDGVITVQEGNSLEYRFERGFLDYQGDDFYNGIIEFELKPSADRAFFYIYFRSDDNNQSEVIYLRTHKSSAPDTVQYSPVFQGRSAWQLYHGDSGTAAASLIANEWNQIRIKVENQRLSMWVGNMQQPVFDNLLLKGAERAGKLRLRGNIPNASQAKLTGMVRNIQVTHLPRSQGIAISAASIPPGMLTGYRVSPAFKATKDAYTRIPEMLNDAHWAWVPSNQEGIVEFLKHRAVPAGSRTYAVVAEVELDAVAATVCPINLGFSDTLTLIHNQRPLFFADASYRYAANRQEGLLHSQQATVYVPLVSGLNTLHAIVADSFGGWGLAMQLLDCEGVSVVTPQQSSGAIAVSSVAHSAVTDDTRLAEHRQRDDSRKPDSLVSLVGTLPGDTVVELAAGSGYYAAILSRVVGNRGHVLAIDPEKIFTAFPSARETFSSFLKEDPLTNTQYSVQHFDELEWSLPADSVFMNLYYHDTVWTGEDRTKMNAAIYAGLKPGGRYVIVDHSAADNASVDDFQRLHRMDASRVIPEVVAAGFQLVTTSSILASQTDDYSLSVFDAEVRGQTDRFIYLFEKPLDK
ncbi:hypothetical protein [Alteromonas flava]|uniref:hypothetical protein n=1 Tax=Alteromonas flava TaxID=2048003 RepID=UPI000C28CEE2|nr:hypothetical protein [Alteromonas flava]